MPDGCSEISVAAIGNEFVKISQTERKQPWLDLMTISPRHKIPIVYTTTSIELPDGTIIYQLDETPLIYGRSNYLLPTPQSHGFCVAVCDVARYHGEK